MIQNQYLYIEPILQKLKPHELEIFFEKKQLRVHIAKMRPYSENLCTKSLEHENIDIF